MLEYFRFTPEPGKNYRYTKNIVAFLDILGFRELVNDQKRNALLVTVFSMIQQMNGISASDSSPLRGIQFSIMSDSIVISVPFRRSGALCRLLMAVQALMELFMANGIFLRGGIAIGKAYHSGNIAFGPAIVEAYQLESNIAIYPRCVISKAALEEGLKTCASENARRLDLEKLRLCEDGVYSYDFFKYYFEYNCKNRSPESFQTVCDEFAQIITGPMNGQRSLYIRAKYEWLLSDLRRAAAEYAAENHAG